MIKTLKGKVLAGTVAVTLVAGSGVAFGASDAGIKIKSWYDVQFGKSSAKVETDYTGYQKDKFEGFDQDVVSLKGNATKNINEVATTQTNQKGQNIDNQKQEHIDAIKKEKANIEGYMANQFSKISAEASNKINNAADEAWKYADAEMLKHTDAAGSEARKAVIKELDAKTVVAVGELKKAIEDAKNELQAELDSNASKTTKELTDLIDTKINGLVKDITNRTNKYLALQYGFITTEAAGLEKKAKDEMIKIVNGI